MNTTVEEVPGDGVYKIEVVDGTKQLAGYCWVVKDSSDRYNYYVMREQYLPPVTGVSALVFNYNPSGVPQSFESLDKFLAYATSQLNNAYPEDSVGHSAILETPTGWTLP